MAIELEYNKAYATADESDVFLSLNSVWQNLSVTEKEDALLWARYYLDDNFDCALSSLDTIPDELKYANCLLAVDYNSEGSLYKNKSEPTVKKIRVKAGDVESEKEYGSGGDNSNYLPPSIYKVRNLLAPICTRINTSGTVNLVRA
jgi:hypothetical protein